MRDNKTNSLPRSGPVFPGSEVDDHGTTVATYFIGSYSYVVPSNFDVSYALLFHPFGVTTIVYIAYTNHSSYPTQVRSRRHYAGRPNQLTTPSLFFPQH